MDFLSTVFHVFVDGFVVFIIAYTNSEFICKKLD